MVSMLALSSREVDVVSIYIIPSRYSPSQNTGKPNNLKVYRAKKPKSPRHL
jgi:hypothetical protein